MPDNALSQRETAILLLLMAEAREFTNPELDKQFGLEISKTERQHLHQLKLIEVGKRGQAFTHALTDDGWARAAEIFREGVPRSSRLAARALEAVVRALVSGLQRYMERTDSRLAEIFGREEDLPPATTAAPVDRPSAAEVAAAPIAILETSVAREPARPSEDVETMIRKAYAQLADKPNAWVSLTRLRPLLGDAPRAEVDATLRRMIALPDVRLVPWESQKSLSQEDRDAAVIIGDQPKHRILIGA
ncbi:hypothetical protein [Microbispora siamensis]|uniref:MarR family transcriptional regulator n=1 Tax=Microbispora siamensis TaxID=564413 RepID=A0ABQ4GV07_9ACTN|nr:hypothetical protein [Microbispora siamensis]GIH65251.1 hypothetical protein Msi02_60680 [Microbispora siamensis]